jgi:hypothetical protein
MPRYLKRKFMDSRSLQQLKNLPNSCIFAFINDSTKECLVSHTKNLKTRIGLLIDDKRIDGNFRLEVLLTEIHDMEYKRIYCQYYVDKFKEQGYKNIGSSIQYIKYRAVVQYSALLKEVLVVLYNKRKDKKIVGSFSNVEDAESFLKQYYGNKELVLPIYAINRFGSTNKVKYKRNSNPKS